MSFDTRVIFDCLKAGIFSQKFCTGENIFKNKFNVLFIIQSKTRDKKSKYLSCCIKEKGFKNATTPVYDVSCNITFYTVNLQAFIPKIKAHSIHCIILIILLTLQKR